MEESVVSSEDILAVRSRLKDKLKSELEEQFANDSCIARYLRARNGDIPKASDLLQKTIEWRRTFKPETITLDDIESAASTGKFIQLGLSKDGCLVICMKSGLDAGSSTEVKVKHLVYFMEEVCNRAAKNGAPEKFVWLLDLSKEGGSRPSLSDISVAKQIVQILSNYYPERLRRAYVINPSGALRFLWTIVKPFLDARTLDKFVMVGSEEEVSVTVAKDIDREQLWTKFGGDLQYTWSYEAYKQLRQSELASAGPS